MARKQAETVLNQKSLELYLANRELQLINESLDVLVKDRTSELEQAIRQAEQQASALHYSNERFKLAMRATSAGLWEWHIGSKQWYFTERLCQLLGYDENELITLFTDWSFIHGEELVLLEQTMAGHLQDKKTFDIECRVKVKDDHYRWFWIVGQAVWDQDGQPLRIAGSFSDIDERVQNARLVEQMAHYDHLTMIPNRMLLNQEMDAAIEHSKDKNEVFAVLVIDVNDFKLINDTMGHAAGDKLLQYISKQFDKKIKGGDILARIGGDEFAIVLREIKCRKNAEQICQSILESIATPFNHNGNRITPKISIGVSIFPRDGQTRSELMMHADLAMYIAKGEKSKGSFYLFCEPDMISQKQERIRLAKEISNAIYDNQFYMVFQPFIDLKTGKITSSEALIRWHHPLGKKIQPEYFIAIAETTGLIIEIGELTIDLVIQELDRLLKANTPVIISVNISPIQFLYHNFVDHIIAKLEKHPELTPYLEIEITEGVLINNIATAKKAMQALHKLGVRLSLDDFGTGYSSLNYLQQLPFDVIKIDQSFIADLAVSKQRRVITATIINLAHSLELKTIAEGVETQSQLDFLQQHQCDYAQGFYFHKPMDAKSFSALLLDKQIANISSNKLSSIFAKIRGYWLSL